MKRDRIYRVAMQRRFKGSSDWENKTLDVLANGSVERAIAAAKKEAVREGAWEDDDGKKYTIAEVSLMSVNVIATADIEG